MKASLRSWDLNNRLVQYLNARKYSGDMNNKHSVNRDIQLVVLSSVSALCARKNWKITPLPSVTMK